jgi:hypothetical protein
MTKHYPCFATWLIRSTLLKWERRRIGSGGTSMKFPPDKVGMLVVVGTDGAAEEEGIKDGESDYPVATDSRMITLTDGTHVEYHASFNFPRATFYENENRGQGNTAL